MNNRTHVACNINCLLENEELLKVTASHVHCSCGNISETVQGTCTVVNIVTTNHEVTYALSNNGNSDDLE